MFAIDVTPRRAAPPLQVDAATAEKNPSPAFSSDERSPDLPTVTTASELTSAGSMLRKVSTSRHTPLAHAPRSEPSNDTLASQLNAASTPVRTILDFYLGTSPSPRHPPNDIENSTPSRHILREDAGKAGEMRSSPLAAATHSSPSTTAEEFHRSPAPGRTYLDEFLAAQDNEEANFFVSPSDSGKRTASENLSSAASSASPGSSGQRRVPGVAMDNSPVVPEMWEETSSSSSSVSRASSAITEGMPKEAVEEGQDSLTSFAPSTAPPHTGHAATTLPLAEAAGLQTTSPPLPDPVGPATPLGSLSRLPPAVERTLLFPAMQPDRRAAGTANATKSPPFLTSSFAEWKTQPTSRQTSSHSEAAKNASAHVSSVDVPPTLGSPQPLLESPRSTAALRRLPQPSVEQRDSSSLKATPQAFSALSYLVRRQSVLKGESDTPSFASRSGRGSFEQTSQRWALSMEGHSTAVPPEPLRRTASCNPGMTVKLATVHPLHGRDLGRQRMEAQVGGYHLQLQPPTTRSNPSTTLAAASHKRRRRSVVSRLYPRPASPPSALTTGEHASELPRWNASTKILYNPLSESIQPPPEVEKDERNLERSRSCTPADYVKGRSSTPRMKSRCGSVQRSPPLAPALQTRTSLLRLQAMSARKAREAAEREEELHPSFRPALAPHSVRICRKKSRELSAATAPPKEAGERESSHTAPQPPPPSATAANFALNTSGHRRFSNLANSAKRSDSTERSSVARRPQSAQYRGPPGGRSVSAHSVATVSNHLYADAAQRRQRQEQRRQERERETELQEEVERRSAFPSPRQKHVDCVLREPVMNRKPTNRKEASAAVRASELERCYHSVAEEKKNAVHAPELPSPRNLQSDASGAFTEELALPRVDFYSAGETKVQADKPYNTAAQQQRVEDCLRAFEEDRQHRLYLLRRFADTRDATTGQKLFTPFTGR
jgi:hypothetical protein